MKNYAKKCWITLLEIKELMEDYRKVNNKESFPAWPFPDKIEPGVWPFPTSQPKEGAKNES